MNESINANTNLQFKKRAPIPYQRKWKIRLETIKLSIDFIKFLLSSLIFLCNFIHFLLQGITFTFQRSHLPFKMICLDINLTKSIISTTPQKRMGSRDVYFSVVSFKFLSFCSASSSNKAIFLNKLSRSPRAPLSSFSSPLNFSSFSSWSSTFLSRSSLRCVREVICWSLEVLSNSSCLILAFNSSILSFAVSVSARRLDIFYRHIRMGLCNRRYLSEFVHC